MSPSGSHGVAVRRVQAAYARIADVDRPEIWITLRAPAGPLAEAAAIDERSAAGAHLPLAGTVLAVKDNVDVVGLPTTVGCPAFAYTPTQTAPAVDRLVAAGAVVLGKTNLDQFATGLVGTRSPYGAVRDARQPDRVSGGSSSGSAVAVALGVADLAVGTDTAGSGRIPAAFQQIVGIKPTRGLIPTLGVVPACRTLDCVTIFARTLPAAEQAIAVMCGPAPGDPTARTWPADAPLGAPSRPRVAVPPVGSLGPMAPGWADAFQGAIAALAATGADVVPVDPAPFLEAGTLLYDGAFVAERYAAVGAFLDANPEAVDPTVRSIVAPAGSIPAHRLVADGERLDRLRLRALDALGDADALLLPTAPEHPTIAEVAADPIRVNARLGRFTTFCNLLDLCAVAVSAPRTTVAPSLGVSVLARGFADRVAIDVARMLTGDPPASAGSGFGPPGIPLVVVGAHLSGLALNGELTAAGGRLVRPVCTAASYRLYALDTEPPKPGLVRVDAGGGSVEGELWILPPAGLAALLAGLPAPMALGRVRLDEGSEHIGFLSESAAVARAVDITSYGGWRSYLSRPTTCGAVS